MQFKITGLEEMQQRLNAKAKSIAYGVSKGINDTLVGVRPVIQKEIQKSFDRPTPIVVNSVLYEKANPNTLSGRIYINTEVSGGQKSSLNVANILRPHIFGGDRITKASESRLRRFGFMGYDQYIAPGPRVPLDQYGNVTGQTMVRILSQIEAFSEGGYTANAKIKGANSKRKIGYLGNMFVIPRVGVFIRIGWASKTGPGNTNAEPLIFFIKKPSYRSRFDFYGTANTYLANNLQKNLKAALTYALASAR